MSRGKPHFFKCFGDGGGGEPHLVERTGRTKANPSRKRGNYWGDTTHEYRCKTCGHVGWSAHPDLVVYYPLRGE